MNFRIFIWSLSLLSFCTIIMYSSCVHPSQKEDKSERLDEESISFEKAHIVSYQNLSVQDFKEKTKNNLNAILIDVRRPEEINQGKIKGALEINWQDKKFAEKILELNKEKEYYIYCRIGGRSAKASRFMIKNGFQNVYNLEVGFEGWNSEKSQN